MRIRKNAKISALLYTNTNLSADSDESLLHKNFCQLNQSPWDIITFPSSDSSSSLHQVDDNEVYYNFDLDGNGSLVDSIGAFESVASKTSCEGENCNVSDTKNDYDDEIIGFKEGGETSEIQQEIVLCGKRDEKGWQCGRVVKSGNTMCDHHLVELQNVAVWTTKKKSRPIPRSTAGSRPRRTKKQPTTNPHEFYYYSGFGPSWGKKRGAMGMDSNATSVASHSNKIHEVSGTEAKRFELEMSETGPMEAELDYVDDDDDDEKGKMGIVGKKRGRKPIKARSLKSLM